MTNMDFAELKTKTAFDEIKEKMASATKKFETDDRVWKATLDQAGNSLAIIRFLPAPKGETDAWCEIFTHGFKGKSGKYYIENSLTTLGKKDPVGEYNSKLWSTGIESNKNQARDQKRRRNFYSNIYVISDPNNPENEGKVFLFRYGKKIFDKIHEAMEPKFEGEQAINPFDFWGGANFKLKASTVSGFRNYDSSIFETPSKFLDGDDDELKKIWVSQYSLKDIVSPDKFKTYEELKRRLNTALGEEEGVADISFGEEVAEDEIAREPENVETADSLTEEDGEIQDLFEKVLGKGNS